MENNEIIEGNKLIAEFDGYKFYPYDILNDIKGVFKKKDKLPMLSTDFKYHKSWDSLMPVVEKIEQQFTVKIIRYADELSNVCEIETTDKNPLQITYSYGYDYDGVKKNKVVFDAVVDFIKWYNKKQLENGK